MKQPIDKSANFKEDGLVMVVDKPLNWTSTDVVRKIKFLLTKIGHKKIKVGHAGTLDPLATGVLVVCVGKATKRVNDIQAEEKVYVADFCVGATTPSYDLEHAIDATYPTEHITKELVEEALKELSGERMQTPPIYSAKRIEGRRAYEYAREGSEVEMRQALINIYEMELLEYNMPNVKVRIRCSKGTYIRSLAYEIGVKLNSGAHLAALCRSRSGDYKVEDGYSMEEIIELFSPESETK